MVLCLFDNPIEHPKIILLAGGVTITHSQNVDKVKKWLKDLYVQKRTFRFQVDNRVQQVNFEKSRNTSGGGCDCKTLHDVWY